MEVGDIVELRGPPKASSTASNDESLGLHQGNDLGYCNNLEDDTMDNPHRNLAKSVTV